MIRIAAAVTVGLLLAGSALAQAPGQIQPPNAGPGTGTTLGTGMGTGTGGRASTTTPMGGRPSSAVPATGSATAGADQFSSEAAAKSHCPGDTVVWVNLGGSKAYHTAGTKYYGKTKHGAYMCQKEADQSGFHAGGHHVAAKKPS